MSFAASLAQRVSAKKQETKEREKEGQKWLEHEATLVDAAVELFKRRCVRAAENMQCSLSVSFEVLTRDVPRFPTYSVKDGSYLVDSWGDVEPASWYYARRGAAEPFTHGLPIQFAELLEGMMPQFLEKVGTLGFQVCTREQGTWKVRVTWKMPENMQQRQQQQQNGTRSNGHTPPNGETKDRGAASGGASASSAGARAADAPAGPARAEAARPKARAREEPAAASANGAKRPRGDNGSASPSRTEVPSGTEVPTSDAEGEEPVKTASA